MASKPTSAAAKLAAISQVLEPKDINYKPDFRVWTYSFQGQDIYYWDVEGNVIDIRLLADTTQASTVEIDLDDSDYTLLQHPLFAHWAFNIQDVSLDSAKKFKTSRLTNSTNNAYLGDNSDLEWVLGQRPIDFAIGNVAFRLCGISTQDTTLTLTFEDRAASWLRDVEGFKTVNRGTYTRAGFVALLCREAGVDYWIPELHVAQPVASSTSSLSPSQNRLVTGKGLSVNQGLTAKGIPLTQSQINVANAILDVGTKYNAPSLALQASMIAGILESTLSTTSTNGTYWGALSGRTDRFAQNDTIGMATCFFKGGKGFTSAITLSASVSDPEQIAEMAEGVLGTGQYQKETGFALVPAEAAKIVQHYGGPSSSRNSGAQTTTTGQYAFTRGPNEDTYDCIQRLASEVAWYAFVRQNRLWFVSGNYLFQQDPQMTIEMGKDGVDTIDLNLDMGARDSIAQCTVMARTSLWAALPGMIVQVNKRGPATGKWFVSSFESHPMDLSQQVQITLQKPVPKRSEPAANTSSNTAAGGLTSKTNITGYVNPFSSATNLSPERVDMGVDYNGSGPIKAIGNAKVFLAMSGGSGWTSPLNTQGFVGYTLLDGIYAGKHVYVAEDISPQVKTGDVVKAGDTIATFLNSSTGCETGWASGQGAGCLAASLNQQHPGGDPGGWMSAAGVSFNRFLVALGAKSGVIAGAPHGTMPAGYP